VDNIELLIKRLKHGVLSGGYGVEATIEIKEHPEKYMSSTIKGILTRPIMH